jgi:hypothetical protein
MGTETADRSRGSAGVHGPTIAGVVGGAFVVWGWSIGLGRLSDNSFFTHLATGRLILDGSFPRSDPYSFTAPGEPWVVQSWLASALYAVVDRLGGGDGLRVLTGLLGALLALAAWRLTRPATTLIPRVAVTALVLAVGSTAWSPRPLLFGLAFLALSLLVVQERWPPWILLPAFWAWANTHGSFPLGLLALGALGLGSWLDARRGGGRPVSWAGVRAMPEVRALAWAAGGTAAGVIGPLGLQALVFPVRLLQRQDLLREVVEWQSPDFGGAWARLFLLQVVLAVVALVRRPSWRAAVPFVVFTAAALLAARNIAVASLVLVPGTARGLADLGTITGAARSSIARVGAAAVVAVAGLVTVVRLGEPAYDLRSYPVDALAWLDQQGGLDGETRVATQETVGNYRELLDRADGQVFVDDRIDMYPEPVIRDFLTLLRGRPGWQDVLDDREVDAVLWSRDEPLAQLLAEDPTWRAAYTDGTWAVWCRRGSDVGEPAC